jgi:hypothetical protein
LYKCAMLYIKKEIMVDVREQFVVLLKKYNLYEARIKLKQDVMFY